MKQFLLRLFGAYWLGLFITYLCGVFTPDTVDIGFALLQSALFFLVVSTTENS